MRRDQQCPHLEDPDIEENVLDAFISSLFANPVIEARDTAATSAAMEVDWPPLEEDLRLIRGLL